MRVCRKCGGDEFTPSGQCRACRREYMKARRAASPSPRPPGRPKRRMPMGEIVPAEPREAKGAQEIMPQEAQVMQTLLDPDKCLAFMLARNLRTMAELDELCETAALRLKDAEENGMVADVKFFMEFRRKALMDRASHDLKLSAELAVWSELLEVQRS